MAAPNISLLHFPIPVAVFRTYAFALMYTTEAVPKKILELMNVPGLTRENVASHLQVLYKSLELRKFCRIQEFETFISLLTCIHNRMVMFLNYPSSSVGLTIQLCGAEISSVF